MGPKALDSTKTSYIDLFEWWLYLAIHAADTGTMPRRESASGLDTGRLGRPRRGEPKHGARLRRRTARIATRHGGRHPPRPGTCRGRLPGPEHRLRSGSKAGTKRPDRECPDRERLKTRKPLPCRRVS